MNVLFVTSEVAPFAKTGGLADVSAALPRYLRRVGHDVRVFLPFYNSIDRDSAHFEIAIPNIDIRLGNRLYSVSIITAQRADLGTTYLVRCPALYHRGSIYTNDNDEHLRFLVLQRAALEAAQRMGFSPDIIHCNDWQTATLPMLLNTRYRWDRLFARSKTLLTIHNLNYQGTFGSHILPDTGLADSAHLFHQDQLREGRLNFLLHGILYADGINTVSPTYAHEIQTPEHGAGLDPFLRMRSSTVVGILNGVDYDEWSPDRDTHIPQRYGRNDFAGKRVNKRALLTRFGLPDIDGVPVFGIVSRLAGQKGFALLGEVLPNLLRRRRFQLIILGSGERRFEQMFAEFATAFPRQIAFYRGFSNPLAHLIEAGSDMFLMPSVYEPCGLNQLYSLRYGTVPVVHKTGGLADTVRQWNGSTGTGFSFEHYDAGGLTWAMDAAISTYHDAPSWGRIVSNGMREDFSWDKQGRIYEELYTRMAGA